MLTSIAWQGPPAVPRFTAGALGRDTAVLAAADELSILHREGAPASMRLERTLQLSFVPACVGLSPSGRFLLASDRSRLELWDRRAAKRVLDFWAAEPPAAIVGGFAQERGGRELLLVNDKGATVRGYDVDSRAQVLSCRAATFRFAAAPLVVGDHLIAAGFFHGEGKDSLVGVELARLITDPESISDHFQRKQGIQDYAHRLCVGPAGDDALVVFRDPEDDEDEPIEEDDPPLGHADVWGFRGIYVRRLDGTLVERIAWDGPVQSLAPIAASPDRIALACTDGIRVLDRAGRETSSPIAAHWLAASPDGAEVLVQASDGGLALLGQSGL